MKKSSIVFLILIILFFISPVMAQNNQIGLLVGLNLASLDFDVNEEEVDINTSIRTGFTLGGSFYLALSSNIGLQFEPAYIQKGSKVEVKGMENGAEIKMEQTIKVNYIDIPILFKASFGQGSTKPYLLAGGNIALKTGDLKVEVDKYFINGQDVTSQISSDDREIELKTKSTDFGLTFGAGILFPVGNNHFFIEGQYNIGLTNIYDDEDPDVNDVKTKGIQIRAGIFFPLGR
jgi:opacity protein-like surface antigen